MNGTGNMEDISAETVPDPSFENLRRDLIAIRVRHGAKTEIGRRCSNLVEQIKSYRQSDDIEQRRQLAKLMSYQMADIDRLTRCERY